MHSKSVLPPLRRLALFALGALSVGPVAQAQVPVQPSANQEAWLKDSNPALAANKRLVYDFWREVLEAGHLDLADKYLAESYIQHNPNVPTGRAGFKDFFGKFAKPGPIDAHIKAPLVAIVAEGDLVVLSFVDQVGDPKDAAHGYTTTAFDMFRVKDGTVVEHWDAMRKMTP